LTHSLHRVGNIENLQNDYVILITPAIGVNDSGSGKKLKKYLRILEEEGFDNVGDVEHGSIVGKLDMNMLKSHLDDGKRIRAAISSKENLKRILKRIKEEKLDLSITVSGLIDNIYDISKDLNINPHSINLSLGVWGNTDKLPNQNILEITTMCGHHMISSNLVEDILSKIEEGKISIEKANEKISKLCVCGIFNTKRFKELLKIKVD
jgi:hypothetical protein